MCGKLLASGKCVSFSFIRYLPLLWLHIAGRTLGTVTAVGLLVCESRRLWRIFIYVFLITRIAIMWLILTYHC